MKCSSRRVRVRVLSCWLSLSILVQSAAACPFCLAPPETWSEILGGADVILVAEMTELRTFEHPVGAEADFRIQTLVKFPGQYSADFTALRPQALSAATRGAESGRADWNENPARFGADQAAPEFLRTGQVLTVPEYVTGQPGDRFLVVGRRMRPLQRAAAGTWEQDTELSGDVTETSGGWVVNAAFSDSADSETTSVDEAGRILRVGLTIPELLQWDSPTPVDPVLLRYLLEAPDMTVPAALRLRYYVGFLESAVPEIAADAWGEFARSDYADVVAVRSHFSTERLRAWIADPQMSPERLGLYGMMLGLCGNDGDADFLKEQIGAPGTGGFRFGLEGLMGGYLLLRGESALEFLEDTRLNGSQTDAAEQFAVLQAVQFLSTSEAGRIPPERLLRTLHLLLGAREIREIVITDLARSRDWQTAPELISLFHQMRSDDRSAQAIVQFMLTLLRAEEKSPGAVPTEHQDVARRFLAQIRTEHPRLLQMTERDFGPPR